MAAASPSTSGRRTGRPRVPLPILLPALLLILQLILGSSCTPAAPAVTATRVPVVAAGAAVTPTAGPAPARPPGAAGEFEEEAVWEGSSQLSDVLWGCIDADEADETVESATPEACLLFAMQELGAAPQAVAFAKEIDGAGFMTEFNEYGRVDLAQVFYCPRPSDMLQYAMVNGTPRTVFASENLDPVDIRTDPLYPTLLQEFPALAIWESLHTFDHVEAVPGGGQRFVFRYDLVDGCHICRTGHTALVAFDFDQGGQFGGTVLLYLD